MVNYSPWENGRKEVMKVNFFRFVIAGKYTDLDTVVVTGSYLENCWYCSSGQEK